MVDLIIKGYKRILIPVKATARDSKLPQEPFNCVLHYENKCISSLWIVFLKAVILVEPDNFLHVRDPGS
jgi:hypothetical protein